MGQFARSNFTQVRCLAASSVLSPEPVVRSLASDPQLSVRPSAATHPLHPRIDLTPPVEVSVAVALALNPAADQADLLALAKKPHPETAAAPALSDSSAVLDQLLSGDPSTAVRAAAASNGALDPTWRVLLISDRDELVREQVATNPALAVEEVDLLINDPAERVRARWRRTAKHWSLCKLTNSAEILLALFDCPSRGCRGCLPTWPLGWPLRTSRSDPNFPVGAGFQVGSRATGCRSGRRGPVWPGPQPRHQGR